MIWLATRIALGGSGLLLAFIGSALLLAPGDFLALSHVFVDDDPSLFSELSAPSVLLLLAGFFMLLGAFRRRHSELALSIGALVYGSYGLGRLVSMVLHGVPSASLVAATLIELAVAAMLLGLRLHTLATERGNPTTDSRGRASLA